MKNMRKNKSYFGSRKKKQITRKRLAITLTEELVDMSDMNNDQGEERCVYLDNKRAKEIGFMLNKAGGFDLMHTVAYLVNDYLRKKREWWQRSDSRELDICWNGIGEWKS